MSHKLVVLLLAAMMSYVLSHDQSVFAGIWNIVNPSLVSNSIVVTDDLAGNLWFIGYSPNKFSVSSMVYEHVNSSHVLKTSDNCTGTWNLSTKSVVAICPNNSNYTASCVEGPCSGASVSSSVATNIAGTYNQTGYCNVYSTTPSCNTTFPQSYTFTTINNGVRLIDTRGLLSTINFTTYSDGSMIMQNGIMAYGSRNSVTNTVRIIAALAAPSSSSTTPWFAVDYVCVSGPCATNTTTTATPTPTGTTTTAGPTTTGTSGPTTTSTAAPAGSTTTVTPSTTKPSSASQPTKYTLLFLVAFVVLML